MHLLSLVLLRLCFVENRNIYRTGAFSWIEVMDWKNQLMIEISINGIYFTYNEFDVVKWFAVSI